MLRTLLAALAALVPAVASAAPPDACGLLKLDEINGIAERPVERVQPQKSGNPSQCGFLDARRAAVLVLTVREVQYAVKDELFQERDTLQKIYRARAKELDTIGDGGFWLAANHQLSFRKGKMIVTLVFSTPRNRTEVDTAQLARLVETRLPK